MELKYYSILGNTSPLHIQLGITTHRMVELDAHVDTMILQITTPTPQVVQRNTGEWLRDIALIADNLQEYAYMSAIFVNAMAIYGRLHSIKY